MKVEFSADAIKRFRSALRQAGPREIGGMLFSEQLAVGHFLVVDFSVDMTSGGHASFQRDPRLHEEALTSFYEKTGKDFQRFNYLGEWHSHPSFSTLPSYEDAMTMTRMVEDSSSNIVFAVLLILRLRFWSRLEKSIMVFSRGQAPFMSTD